MSIFDLRGSPSQALVHFAWTLVKYNTVLLISWIILLSLAQYRMMAGLGKLGIAALRRFSLSSLGRTLIGDMQWLANHCYTWILTFVAFNGAVYYVRRRFDNYQWRTQKGEGQGAVAVGAPPQTLGRLSRKNVAGGSTPRPPPQTPLHSCGKAAPGSTPCTHDSIKPAGLVRRRVVKFV